MTMCKWQSSLLICVATLLCAWTAGAQQKGQVPDALDMETAVTPPAEFTNENVKVSDDGETAEVPAPPTPMPSAQTSSEGSPPNPPSSDPGFHVDITPYLWFSGINGTVGVRGYDASVHASASDVLSNFDIGFMVGVEPRYNRIVFPIDFMWIKLSDTKGLPFEEGFYSVKATLKEAIFTQKAGYRLVDRPRFKLDALFGYRYWHGSTSLNLQPVMVANGVSASAGWVDAVAGGRFDIGLTKKVFVTVFGDAGGGSAKYDYQIGGVVGMRIAEKWKVGAGYRYIAVNYNSHNSANFLYDVAMSGVVIGAIWSPK
ncbi:MAG TPA: hypothetical protein VMH20_20265 [Verrucomicrobiae bacterium]|nr:hypothetical protein [Verrucomicrobiae bacterium]